MSSRVAGAGLALIAAALFAVSIATPVVVPAEFSLFAGHPTVNGQMRAMQDVYVGFYGAQLCNTGGDGACLRRDPKKAFQITAFAELGVSGLLAASAVMLVLLILRKSERRKGLARLLRLLAVLAAGGAGALIVLGPTDQGTIPIGMGMAMYGAAIVSVLLASVIAVRPPQPIKLRVASQPPRPVAGVATPRAPQPFDRRALFREDQLRPSDLGPEPMLRRDPRARPEPPPPVSGEPGDAPAPIAPPVAPPIAPSGGDKPLFASAPQLRPLYDATPLQGGTGGLLPVERPAMPVHPPTPLPRAEASAVAGIPTSSPLPTERPRTLPPPNFGARSKPASMPPPLPPGPQPRTQVSLVPPMPDKDASSTAAAVHTTRPHGAPPEPGSSDGSPEAAESPPNTEPVQFPIAETPLAPPPLPVSPSHRPRAETPLLPPPPPVGPAPRPQRESNPPPPPRPVRDTQSPRPGLRASVPMPERPGRQTASPTQPPPLSIGALRGVPTRPPAPPPALPPRNIPPIPAIPAPGNRAETDPQERAGTLDQSMEEATGPGAPLEVGDSTSPTHVSLGVASGEELDAAIDAAGTPDEPVDPTDENQRAVSASDAQGVVTPAPVALVAPAPAPPAMAPPVRDRPIPKLPISTAPDSLPPPKDHKEQTGPSPACPQCESPMAWVEEHLRFYCKSCRMYF